MLREDDVRRQIVQLVIDRIRMDFQQGKMVSRLHKKSRRFLMANGYSYNFLLEMTIEVLKNATYFRGPTPHHWLTGQQVYEFIVSIDGLDMYVKFVLGSELTGFESIHEKEKPVDPTWTKMR